MSLKPTNSNRHQQATKTPSCDSRELTTRPAQPEWATKEHAAEYLQLSVRRVLELAAQHGWQTKKDFVPGRRQVARLILFQNLVDYKASLTAATIDQAGNQVARVK